MPHARLNGTDLYYEDHGDGPAAVVFAHGLLWSGRMFDAQVLALRDRYRCITFDFRGQGRSAVAATGYDMDTLTEDTAALIRALGAAPCHVVGLSMGGFVGMRLALRRPELLRSLSLLNTSADPEPGANLPKYRLLNLVARWLGLRLVAGQVLPILFGRTFMTDPARVEQRAAWRERLLEHDRIGITRAVQGVIDRAGVYDDLLRITTPTLVLVGEEDVATVPAKGERIAARIPGARLVTIPEAGHSSTIEAPQAVTAALTAFLDEHTT